MDRTLKFRLQQSADDTLECFDSWILITMLSSRDMANFVSQEAYERASLTETSNWNDEKVCLVYEHDCECVRNFNLALHTLCVCTLACMCVCVCVCVCLLSFLT